MLLSAGVDSVIPGGPFSVRGSAGSMSGVVASCVAAGMWPLWVAEPGCLCGLACVAVAPVRILQTSVSGLVSLLVGRLVLPITFLGLMLWASGPC